jgi:hypothetical protein
MDFHLEKEIILLDHTKRDGYYPWCLREISFKPIDEDEPFVIDYVPWSYGFHFTVSDIALIHRVDFEGEDKLFPPDNDEFKPREEASTIKVKDSEFIKATLHSGICNDGENLEQVTKFSMFGTDRIINNFNLQIFCIDNIEYSGEDRHSISGNISHTWEGETEPDSVCINFWLSKNRFDKLAKLISDKSVNVATVSIRDIPGFYSEHSAVNIRTSNVKVLTGVEEQKITIPERCDITLPTLGDIGQFNLSLITGNILNPKRNFNTLNAESLFEEPQEEEHKTAELIAAHMTQNQMIASKVNNSLRFISVCLVILLLSTWL